MSDYKYSYDAKVIRIVDGDTIELCVDLGFKLSLTEKFRFDKIDTAEIFRPRNAAEKEHGLESTDWLIDKILGKTIRIHTSKSGKYGRWLIDLYLDDENIQTTMFNEGFAKREEY